MTKKNWQLWMEQAKKIQREDRANLFDLVKILGRVADDPDYKQSQIKKGEGELTEIEAMIRESCSIHFSNLRAMRRKFTNKLDWIRNTLADLDKKITDAIRAKKVKQLQGSGKGVASIATSKGEQTEKPKPDPRHFTQEIADRDQRIKELEHQVDLLQIQVTVKANQIDTLQRALDALAPPKKEAA